MSLTSLFCTEKNPYPILPHLKSLSIFDTFWHVTITPYGRDIEPNVPSKRDILSAFQYLSHQIGANRIVWRYGPHSHQSYLHDGIPYQAFSLHGRNASVHTKWSLACIDLYEKTKRNFPEARPVSAHDQVLVNAFSEIAKKTQGSPSICAVNRPSWSGTMSMRMALSQAVSKKLLVKKSFRTTPQHRGKAVPCLLGADIGACSHSAAIAMPITMKPLVRKNYQRHDPASALLIGHLEQGDIIKDAQQKSWKSPEISLF